MAFIPCPYLEPNQPCFPYSLALALLAPQQPHFHALLSSPDDSQFPSVHKHSHSRSNHTSSPYTLTPQPPHLSQHFNPSYHSPLHQPIIIHHHPSTPPPSPSSFVSPKLPDPHYSPHATDHQTQAGADTRRPLSPVSAIKPAKPKPRPRPKPLHNVIPTTLIPSSAKHSTITRYSSPTHRSTYHPLPSLNPMTDANYTRTSPPARTSSLADLVHKTETHPAPHRTSHPRQSPDSDNGSQQERNHQRPRPHSNLPTLPIPQAQDVSATLRHVPADCSPKHPYRKRKHSHPNPSHPPDFSSLTHKLDDHASSVAPPVSRDQPMPNSPPQQDDQALDKFPPAPLRQEGSTEIIPHPVSRLANLSPHKQRRRIQSKQAPERADLLEENRLLRIELENAKYSLRKSESEHRKTKKDLHHKDDLLAKYRRELVARFEAAGADLYQLNKPKYSADSPGNATPSKRGDDINSKVDGESISDSQEEDSSTYSGPSLSQAYDEDKSEDIRRRGDKDPYGRSDATIRKHRRTRAPAWTPEEESLFKKAYSEHGCRWKLFQDVLPGRSRRQIQSHGSYLIRQGKLSKKNSRPWQRRKPRNGNEGAGPSSEVKDAELEAHDGGGASDRE